MDAAVWGFVGTLVGALSSIGTTWISKGSSYSLQNARNTDERLERSRAFQRETLLALQEAMHDSLRLNARAHLEILQDYRRTGKWSNGFLSEEVNEGLRLASRSVTILRERVSDALLRASVKELAMLAADGRIQKSEQEAESFQQKVLTKTIQVFEQIGSVLRSNY